MTKLSKAEINALDTLTMAGVVEAANLRLQNWQACPERHKLLAANASHILMAQLGALGFVEDVKTNGSKA